MPSILGVVVCLLLTGCAHSQRSYAPTDEFFASGRFSVPSEFRHGTAGRADVDAWAISLLGDHPLESRRIDIDGDQIGELFVSELVHYGTGGNSYLVFKERRRGYRYLGTLFFNSLRPVPADKQGKVRVLTSSHSGGCECQVNIELLDSDGFHCVASRNLPCGDGASDGQGGQLVKSLFEPKSPPPDALRLVFGDTF